jgi:gamma-glutamylcyclotransferase (GGCT)/AIG2-like uncharacterized protein YtfP
MATYFFVYGTLKRGEANADVWPHQPDEVRPAVLGGAVLYDLGPYPAMAHSGAAADRVAGELWRFDDEAKAEQVRDRLDGLEGYRPGRKGNLYNRERVVCHGGIEAWAYFFARPLKGDPTMTSAEGPVEWKGRVR